MHRILVRKIDQAGHSAGKMELIFKDSTNARSTRDASSSNHSQTGSQFIEELLSFSALELWLMFNAFVVSFGLKMFNSDSVGAVCLLRVSCFRT